MKIERVSSSSLLMMSFYWLCLCSDNTFEVSGLCLNNERSLLLQLKNNVTFYFGSEEDASKMKTWNGTDCCRWKGVTCDKEGHVTGLDLSGETISGGLGNSNSTLFHLQHLQNLSLAENFIHSEIPSGFNKLDNLRYLNLAYAGFEGQIPIEISQLTRLVSLDLSCDTSSLKLEKPNLRKLVENLTSIRQLYLDGVTVTDPGKEWSNALLPLGDLQELSMSLCDLSGPLDSSLAKLENLSVIILEGNNLSSTVPETFSNMKSLTILNLAGCGLNGTFPQKVFQIATLSFIDLSFNYNLQGVLPDSLSGSLQTLKVRMTSFSGAFSYSIINMTHLSYLDLSACQFNGTLPNSLSNLTALSHLDFSSNKFTGPVPSFGLAKKLTHLDLSHNALSGAIPSSLFTLPLLEYIDLSHNKFCGGVQLYKLLEHRNLTRLDLSYNNLTVNVDVTNSDLSFFSQFEELLLASCNLKSFPGFLKNQSRLWYLDLQDNQIPGTVPNWIWKLPSLQYFNISHNLLTNLEGPLHNLTSKLVYLDVHNNQLQGTIPSFATPHLSYFDYSRNRFTSIIPKDIVSYMPQAHFLSLSNNNFHGSIPHSLCNASLLQVLDLSINNISGAIPSCLQKMNLDVLNLQKNNLTGHIPDMFPASCALRTLNLNGNSLDGPIPTSLAHCSKLEVLNLGTNRLIGGFPCFLNNISTLRVLVLRNNDLQGSIGCPKAKKNWKMLQILDIAFNNFSGKLPGKHFTTWETMMRDNTQAMSDFDHIRVEVGNHLYYEDSVTVVYKGQHMELVKILTIFTCIDLASNHFEGPIPEELMDFKALHVLNLSNNAFSGEIPSSIGNMKNIESLDLSLNNLHGEIPAQLAGLTFLSYLNLSFNHLVGKIPTSTQLQSFQNSSFEGNDGLYGPPLTEEPKGKKQGLQPHAQPSCGKLTCKIDWNFLSVELGLVSGLGAVFFPLLFWKSWRVQYWGFVDKVLCWIFPQLHLERVARRGLTSTVLRWWH